MLAYLLYYIWVNNLLTIFLINWLFISSTFNIYNFQFSMQLPFLFNATRWNYERNSEKTRLLAMRKVICKNIPFEGPFKVCSTIQINSGKIKEIKYKNYFFRSHEGVKPYECKVTGCSKAFYRSGIFT